MAVPHAPLAWIAIVDPGDTEVIRRLREILPPGALRPATLPQPAAGPALTERQRAIVPLLARDLSNKEIGRALCISHFTVRNHVSQLLRVLGASDRRAAVAMLALSAQAA